MHHLASIANPTAAPPSAALPLPYDYDALLAELLFSQMLALPQPQYKPIAYSCLIVRPAVAVLRGFTPIFRRPRQLALPTQMPQPGRTPAIDRFNHADMLLSVLTHACSQHLHCLSAEKRKSTRRIIRERCEGCTCTQVDLCKAVKAFPKSMSGCVRELFARMEVRRTLAATPSVAAPCKLEGGNAGIPLLLSLHMSSNSSMANHPAQVGCSTGYPVSLPPHCTLRPGDGHGAAGAVHRVAGVPAVQLRLRVALAQVAARAQVAAAQRAEVSLHVASLQLDQVPP